MTSQCTMPDVITNPSKTWEALRFTPPRFTSNATLSKKNEHSVLATCWLESFWGLFLFDIYVCLYYVFLLCFGAASFRSFQQLLWVLTTYHHANVGYTIILWVYKTIYIATTILPAKGSLHLSLEKTRQGFPLKLAGGKKHTPKSEDTTLDIQTTPKKAVNFLEF